MYKCPKCGSTNLGVCVITDAKLIQDPDGNLQTQIETADHVWDHSHNMWCNDCGHCDCADAFWAEDPK